MANSSDFSDQGVASRTPVASFGDQLKHLRGLHNLSQEALGKLLGVHKPQISSWERGRFVPSLASIKRLEEVFGTGAMSQWKGEETAALPADFGERLMAIREKQHISARELARRLGISVVAVRKWELGRAWPRVSNMQALALALEVPLTELFQVQMLTSPNKSAGQLAHFGSGSDSVPDVISQCKAWIAGISGASIHSISIRIGDTEM